MKLVSSLIGFVAIFVVIILISSCNSKKNKHLESKVIVDAAGRSVKVPKQINRIIALQPGALRLISYLGATEKVVAVEGNEKRRSVPYLFANPDLRKLPVVGSGNVADIELLASYKPDAIVITYFSYSEAEELERKTGIPVVVVDYGDLLKNKDRLFSSLVLLGKLLNKPKRADSLINTIEFYINDLKKRAIKARARDSTDTDVYIGGIAYRGAHGISSTQIAYPPFRFLQLKGVGEIISKYSKMETIWPENATIDPEALINHNPDYIFLDAAGKLLWQKEVEKDIFRESLSALKKNNTYIVLPHNWYTTNYENLLCNSYFIGKVVYGIEFNDIDVNTKSDEIYKAFLNKPVYDSLEEKYAPFKQFSTTYE